MPKYTVCAAFYDQDNRATVTVEAENYRKACEKVIEMIDAGEVDTDTRTFDPCDTFVYGVVKGTGSPWDGMQNVPLDLREDAVMSGDYYAACCDMREAMQEFCTPYREVTDAQLRHAIERPKGTVTVCIPPEIAQAVLRFREVLTKHRLLEPAK